MAQQGFRTGGMPPGIGRRIPGTIEVPRGLPTTLVEPSQPGAFGGASPSRLIALPPANFAPADSTPVDVIGDANIAPGGSGIIVTIVIPDALRLHIEGIGFGAGDEAAQAFLTWSINQSGDAVTSGYNNVQSVIGSITQLARVNLNFGSSLTITVVGQAVSTAVLTYQYLCRVWGWLYMQKEPI